VRKALTMRRKLVEVADGALFGDFEDDTLGLEGVAADDGLEGRGGEEAGDERGRGAVDEEELLVCEELAEAGDGGEAPGVVDLLEEVAGAGGGEELLRAIERGRRLGAGKGLVAEDIAGGEGADRLAEGADGAGFEHVADGPAGGGGGQRRGEWGRVAAWAAALLFAKSSPGVSEGGPRPRTGFRCLLNEL
jgi:hypothetical protein